MTGTGGVADVTEDVFLGGRLRLLQPAKGYRAGMDAVLLAAAADIASGQGVRVLDAGAGVGAAGLCLAARVADVRVTLLEIVPALAALADSNIARNQLSDRVRVIEADLCAEASRLEAVGVAAASFDHVIANPPYLEAGRHRLPPEPVSAAAFGMAADGLDRWMRALSRAVAPGGSVTLIHRADALAKIFVALEGRFGGAKVLPVHPRVGEPAHRVVVSALKGSRAPLQLSPGGHPPRWCTAALVIPVAMVSDR
jgi:tRNA1(Val) A37 N6-methylase TrmN6